jgi:hypothetical protein
LGDLRGERAFASQLEETIYICGTELLAGLLPCGF